MNLLSTPEPYEAEVASLIARTPARAHRVVFIGSSTFRMWEHLGEDLGDIDVANHGFGGSTVADCSHYWDRLVGAYGPELIVLYAGDNDLAEGKSVSEIVRDYGRFLHRGRKVLPRARVLFVSIKPSPARAALRGAQDEVNATALAWAVHDPRVGFVDIRPIMLDAQGEPRPELFVEDGLHLSAAGYAAWAEVLRPRLQLELSPRRGLASA